MILKIIGTAKQELACAPGQSVLAALLEAGVYMSAPCGGKGHCGKCRVRFLSGSCAPGTEDARHFTEEELAAGWRLACCAFPESDCVISLAQPDEADFDVLAEVGVKEEEKCAGAEGFFFAVDIGTTTLAVSLVSAADGTMCDTYTGVNHQRAFGADVISRIRAFDEGNGAELTALIKRDLLAGMETLAERRHIAPEQIEKTVIAGNTTMGHLLLGYDCHGLGQMPFTAVNLKAVTLPFRDLFGGGAPFSCPVTVLPGFSAYVGGDIVSGLLCTSLDREEKPSLFIDLGTNGEMAVGNRERLLVTSTAAGPAFEGGNLSCGVGSVNGAISQVAIDENAPDQPQVGTVGGKPPLGVCGTGVIETVAELLRTELLEESGLLDEAYFDDGYVLAQTESGTDISVTQKDIRELQLAKAAVRAGLETLLVRYGVGYDELAHVYVAGGFGVHLDMKKAASIGLVPEELLGKITAAGNTSLGGAVCYGMQENAQERCEQMIRIAEEVDLSTDKAFQEFYMDAMFFE